MSLPRPTGRNLGRYFGESVDVDSLLASLVEASVGHRWNLEHFLDLPDRRLALLHREGAEPSFHVYLSAGVHGDEPAGFLAMAELIRQNNWPQHAALWICPCLNPTGFRRNTRENAEGIDLNRDYKTPRAAEVEAHCRLLDRLPAFDLAICLHEDWEAQGFYLYELNPDHLPSLAAVTIEAVSRTCPIDHSSEIDGRPAVEGIIRPDHLPIHRPEWPEAFYLIQHKTRLSYTLEAPSDFDLPVRVNALVTAVQSMVAGTAARF